MNAISKEIELIKLETGLMWPFYQKEKALSSNTLTKILKELEYIDIPVNILKKAAENGKKFHQAIQNFLTTGETLSFLQTKGKLDKTELKIKETINFFQKANNNKSFKGVEKLHYAFYKGKLLASYVDLEFDKFIIELKSNNFKSKSEISILVFEIQLLIQYICTKKDVFLLWSTGEGIIYKKFKFSSYSLKILDMLIDLLDEKKLNEETKKKIAKKIAEDYLPFELKKVKNLPGF